VNVFLSSTLIYYSAGYYSRQKEVIGRRLKRKLRRCYSIACAGRDYSSGPYAVAYLRCG
jgi:hypothetical protein